MLQPMRVGNGSGIEIDATACCWLSSLTCTYFPNLVNAFSCLAKASLSLFSTLTEEVVQNTTNINLQLVLNHDLARLIIIVLPSLTIGSDSFDTMYVTVVSYAIPIRVDGSLLLDPHAPYVVCRSLSEIAQR